MRITAAHVIQFIEGAATRIKAHRDELIALDAAIGDADHGINMDRGFSSVLEKLPSLADKDIGTILKTVGMTLVSTVGGASGPLYGTAFVRAGMALADRETITPDELVEALAAALAGIQSRGKAQRGEKTMIDAIGPGVDVLQQQASDADFVAVLRRSVAAVEAGMQSTIPMLATKGRASYLGQRSVGHQDPGATSAFYIAQALLETVESIEE